MDRKKIDYDLDYYDGLLRMYSGTAELISGIRWEFVRCVKPETVLDYGCGIGWFRAFRPNGCEVDTFDIMPVVQSGITREEYDLVTFWDVIEHMDDGDFYFIVPLIESARYVAMTVPIFPGGRDIRGWKHFKPGEHVRYFFNIEAVDKLVEPHGLKRIKQGYVECPPRSDIVSLLYANREKGAKNVGKVIELRERKSSCGPEPETDEGV